jgi:N-acetylglutamate synthase-like GNAT family acetyltransferase
MTTAIIPIPRFQMSVRPATLADVPFIDALQKQHATQLGFMADTWIENKIKKEIVLVSEDSASMTPIGYVMGVDRYFKHDDVGLVHQLAVVPGSRRGLVGATLLKALFDASAYGVRLYCCWCAQDLDANLFWESCGFVPLAFRTGSLGKKKGQGVRTHIFWQKRIREGDTTTPWWFPAKTDGGAMRADRLVFPIPPGKTWRDEMPVMVPVEQPELTDQRAPKTRKSGGSGTAGLPGAGLAKQLARQWGPPPSTPEVAEPAVVEKPKQGGREKKPKVKVDPKLIAAARELRDRYLEHVNSGQTLIEASGKYDVARVLPESPASTKLLAA